MESRQPSSFRLTPPRNEALRRGGAREEFIPTDLLGDLMDRQQENREPLLAQQNRQRRQSPYADLIRQQLAKSGHVGKYDVRHVEGFMRLEHSTLDGLSASQFASEVEISRQALDAAGASESELVAQSYGL